MTDYENMRERDAARAKEMKELFVAIAVLMPDWKVKKSDDGEGTYRAYVLEKDELAIHFNRDQSGKADKVNIGTWSWPGYSYTERGDVRKASVTPRDLHDPKEDSPSITCSISRGAEAIVKDINRRFLPEYERIYFRCAEKAKAHQEYADKSRDGWKAICETIAVYSGKPSVDPKHSSHSVPTILGDYNFGVDNRNGTAHVTLDCSAANLAKILEVLKK